MLLTSATSSDPFLQHWRQLSEYTLNSSIRWLVSWSWACLSQNIWLRKSQLYGPRWRYTSLTMWRDQCGTGSARWAQVPTPGCRCCTGNGAVDCREGALRDKLFKFAVELVTMCYATCLQVFPTLQQPISIMRINRARFASLAQSSSNSAISQSGQADHGTTASATLHGSPTRLSPLATASGVDGVATCPDTSARPLTEH